MEPSTVMLAAVALAAAAAGGPPEAGSKPHIISILQVLRMPPPPAPARPCPSQPLPLALAQDDLGYDDTGIHNPAAAAWTKNITALAKEGIVLTNHCAHPPRPAPLASRWPAER